MLIWKMSWVEPNSKQIQICVYHKENQLTLTTHFNRSWSFYYFVSALTHTHRAKQADTCEDHCS